MALHPLLEILLRHDGARRRAVNRREWGSELRPAMEGLPSFRLPGMPGRSFFRPDMNKPVNHS
jgi:hypothetical protein